MLPRLLVVWLLSGMSVANALASAKATKHFIGIDLGTSGCRISVLESKSESGTKSLPLQEVYAKAVLWQEDCPYDDASSWVKATRDLIRSASLDVPSIATTLSSICISGTSASCVVMDRSNGKATRKTRMYNYSVGGDNTAQQAALKRLVEHAPQKHTATSPTGSLAKLLAWQAESALKENEVLAHQADYVVSQLLGPSASVDHSLWKVVSDWHNCLKLGYDVRQLAWPEWLQSCLKEEGLNPAKVLPDKVVSPGQPVGQIHPSVAKELGVAPSTQLVGGTTDSNAAFMAAAENPTLGTAVTSLGSTLAIKLLSPIYVEDATYGVYSHRFPKVLLPDDAASNSSSDDSEETWLVGGASNVGCTIFRELQFSNDELADLSKGIDPVERSPYEYYPLVKPGERFPVADPNKQAVLEPRPESRQEFLKGLLESLTAVEVDGFARLHEMGAPWPSKVWTCGGGARNDAWMAMREDRLRYRIGKNTTIVARAPHVEASYGAATLAAASFTMS